MIGKATILHYWRNLKPAGKTAVLAGVIERQVTEVAATPQRILLIAETQARRGDLVRAERTVESGRRRFPEDSALGFRAAFLLERLGEFDRARDIYLALAEDPTANPQTTYRLARTLERLGDEREALSWALYYTERFPADARGNVLAYRLARSEPIWRRYAILAHGAGALSADVRWRSDLIILAYKMRRFTECVGHYENFTGAMDRRTVAHVTAAYMELDRIDDAWRAALTVPESSGGSGGAARPGDLMKELGCWTWAKDLYELDYCSTPSSTLAYAIAFCAVRLFDWDVAEWWYRIALPGNRQAEIRYHLGVALERQGKLAEAAEEYLRAASEPSPLSYRVYRAMVCLHEAGDHELAERILHALEWPESTISPIAKIALAPSERTERDLRTMFEHALRRQDLASLAFVAREAIDSGLAEFAVDAATALVRRSSSHSISDHLLLARAHLGAGMVPEALEALVGSRIHRRATFLDQGSYERNPMTTAAMRYGSFREFCAIDADAVLYESNHGGKLTCNVLALALEMVRDPRLAGCTHYIVVPSRDELPEALRDNPAVVTLPRDSDLYLRTLATAATLISNNTFPSYFSRRSAQKYLNMWHGTPLKAMGRDIKNGSFDYRNAARNFLHVTHFALPNAHTRTQLLDRYDVAPLHRAHVALTGSPRMDLTFAVRDSQREECRARMGVPVGATAILYAPTWRGNLGEVDANDDQVAAVLDRIRAAGHKALYRGHPVTGPEGDDDTIASAVVAEDIDSNILVACVDAVISDYSSIAVDAALAGRPVALFAPDEEEYGSTRGFALDIRTLGLPVLGDIDELSAWLDAEENRTSPVLPDELSRAEDGHASARVLDFLFTPEPPPTEHAEPTVLLFEGHFIPNGISSAATELNTALSSRGISPVVAVEPTAITPFDDRLPMFERATSGSRVLPRIAGAIDTAEQRWLIDRQHEGHHLSRRQLDAVHSAYAVEFERLYGQTRFDAVVGFEGFSLYWANLMSAARASRKIAYLHAEMREEAMTRFPYLWSVFDTYAQYDALACVSAGALEENRQKLGAWSRRDQFVLSPNIISTEEIRQRASEEVDADFEEFCAAHPYRFVSVGRISIEKGSDRLVEAFIEAARSASGIGLVIVGDGPLTRQLRRTVDMAGIGSHVHFTVHLSNPYPVMARCETLVMASRHEGQGIVVLEALVLGLDVVSVDIAGPRSILADGTGALVPNSTDGLVRGMREATSRGSAAHAFDGRGYEQSAVDAALRTILGADPGRAAASSAAPGGRG